MTAVAPSPDEFAAADAPARAGGEDTLVGQRAATARYLVDVLALPSGQMNDHERAFAGDILNELLNFVSEALKRDISERLSSVMAPPPNLLRRLLLEPIDVAAPIMNAFRDIPDSMLIEASRVSASHRRQIARRLKISDGLADALLDSEEKEICELVLRRDDIYLSETRIDQLVQRTIHEESLRLPLLSRLELQPRHGFAMFWWLGESDRRRVLSRFAMDRSLIQNALKPLYREVFPDPDPDLVVKRILTLCDRRHRPRGKNGEAVSMEMVEKTLIAARANPTPDLCNAAGLLAGVSRDTATRALFDVGGEPFAVLSKSIGVSRSAFQDILESSRSLRPCGGLGPAFSEVEGERLIEVFDLIARDYSRTILRYWDWRRDAQTMHAEFG